MELLIKILLIVLLVVTIGCFVGCVIIMIKVMREWIKMERIMDKQEVLEKILGIKWDDANKIYWWERRQDDMESARCEKIWEWIEYNRLK